MRRKFKSAIGQLAAALMLGNTAWAADVLEPVQGQIPAPGSVEAVEDPKVQQEVDSRAVEAEDEDEYAPRAILTDLLIGHDLAEKTGLFINGYIVQSYTYNAWNPASRINGPVTWNDRANDWLLNQSYLSIGRNINTEDDNIQLGARADFMYGSDAIFTNAYLLESAGGVPPNVPPTALGRSVSGGEPIYRWAFPQFYGELFLPVAEGLRIQGGHFYTILGYEVVTSPDNFFTTLPYTFQYGEPFTHTGVMAKLQLTETLLLHNCAILGWDSWQDNNSAMSYMGGFTWTPTEKTNVTWNIITGPEQDSFGRNWFQGIRGNGSTNRTVYSLVVQQQLAEKIKYVFQHDYGFQDPSNLNGFGGNAQWYGINQYLFYNLNKKWSFGVRGEWFRDDDGVRVGSARYTSTLGPQAYDPRYLTPNITVPYGNGVAGANYYALTCGLNYLPTPNIVIRPDIRWDWQTRDEGVAGAPQALPAYNDFTRSQQFIMSLNLILKF